MLVYGTIRAHMHKLCSLNFVTTKLALAMWLGSSSFSAGQTIIDARAQARVWLRYCKEVQRNCVLHKYY